MEKKFIKNRRGQKICVLLQIKQRPKGVVFIMHGLGAYKTQPQLNMIARTFGRAGYSVIRFDAGNSFGESYGKFENATITQYFHDLEDVIRWSKKQTWFIKPFVMVGHSLGAGCSALYAAKHPTEVKALAPLSSVISGKLSQEHYTKKELGEWKSTGWRVEYSHSGKVRRLPWKHMLDRLKYDILPHAKKLSMPTLMMVGSKDQGTPLRHQKKLFDKISGPKELHTIMGAEHTFRTKSEFRQIEKIFDKWIRKIG